MRLRASLSSVTVSELARHDADIARLFPDALPKIEPYEPIDPLDDLSTLQQAALLSLHDDTHLRRKLSRLVLGDSQDIYGAADFAALRAMKLAEKPDGYRLHRITWQGSIAASDLMKALCRKHQIHEMSKPSDCGTTNRYFCSCGGWQGSQPRGVFATTNAQGSHSKHVREERAKAAKKAAAGSLQRMPKEASA